MTRSPKVAFCGPSRSGKDEAARWLSTHTPLRFSRTTSEAIAPHVARRLGLAVEVAFARRHQDRYLWFEVGNELRAVDPAFLVRETLRDGDICVGLRQAEEVTAARDEDLIDLFVWVDRDVPDDPTMTFGPELCDVVVPNRGSLAAYHSRLAALAAFAGLVALQELAPPAEAAVVLHA